MITFWDALQVYRDQSERNKKLRQLSGKDRQAIEALQNRQPKHCRFCCSPLSGRKTAWCNSGCVNAYFLVCGYPRETAEAIRQRDEETCQMCGLDLARLVSDVYDSICEEFDRAARKLTAFVPKQFVRETYTVRQASELLSWLSRNRIWQVDHVVPVCMNGGVGFGSKDSYGLDNLRILCRPCHKHITSKLQRDLRKKC